MNTLQMGTAIQAFTRVALLTIFGELGLGHRVIAFAQRAIAIAEMQPACAATSE